PTRRSSDLPPSLTVWLLWHAAAAVVVTLIPSQLRLGGLMSLPDCQIAFLIEIAATYLASILVLTLWTRGGRGRLGARAGVDRFGRIRKLQSIPLANRVTVFTNCSRRRMCRRS